MVASDFVLDSEHGPGSDTNYLQYHKILSSAFMKQFLQIMAGIHTGTTYPPYKIRALSQGCT